jgi:hypothetical protein
MPYWRTLKAGGVINEKYPGGAVARRELPEYVLTMGPGVDYHSEFGIALAGA